MILFLLLAAGLWFHVICRFLPFTHPLLWLKRTIFSLSGEGDSSGDLTRLQSLCTSLAATIGTGNIVGVAAILISGGPGAIFWMWVSALLGMMTAYAEKVLGHRYRYRDEAGQWVGGAMVTIERGLGCRPLALVYTFLCILSSFGMANMMQAGAVADAAKTAFSVPPTVTGLILAGIIGLLFLKGRDAVGRLTSFLVPFMSVFYLLAVAGILVACRTELLPSFRLIVSQALGVRQAVSGAAGYGFFTVFRAGVSGGTFSNEAGLGTSVIAHAQSSNTDCVEQGFWGILEVFLDTIVMCTLSALALLVTGVYRENTADGAAMMLSAFRLVYSGAGEKLLAVSLIFFAVSTLISWSYFGCVCARYLVGESGVSLYRALFLGILFPGVYGEMIWVWNLACRINEWLAVPNLICLFALSGEVVRLTNAYLHDKTKGKHSKETTW